MKWGRRVPLMWLALGAVALCGWCSVFSGVGGWLVGRDTARREAKLELATAVSADLPPLGVLVTRLDRSGPSARAGVLRGDLVVAVDGTHIHDARALHDQLSNYQPDDVVRLTLLRDQIEEDVTVQLGSFPGDDQRPYLGIYYTARAEEPADL